MIISRNEDIIIIDAANVMMSIINSELEPKT